MYLSTNQFGETLKITNSRFLSVLLISFSLTYNACSSTHVIQPKKSIHISKKGTLYWHDFLKININEFYTKGDSIFAIKSNTGELLQYHRSVVKKIEVKKRLKGAWQGTIIGAVGLSVFAYLTYDPDEIFSRNESTTLGFILGAPYGAVIGFIYGSKDVYKFDTSKSNRIESRKDFNK